MSSTVCGNSIKSNIPSIPKFGCEATGPEATEPEATGPEATEPIGVAKAVYWLVGEVDVRGDDDDDDASDAGGMVFSEDEVGTLVSFGAALSIFSTTRCSRAEM